MRTTYILVALLLSATAMTFSFDNSDDSMTAKYLDKYVNHNNVLLNKNVDQSYDQHENRYDAKPAVPRVARALKKKMAVKDDCEKHIVAEEAIVQPILVKAGAKAHAPIDKKVLNDHVHYFDELVNKDEALNREHNEFAYNPVKKDTLSLNLPHVSPSHADLSIARGLPIHNHKDIKSDSNRIAINKDSNINNADLQIVYKQPYVNFDNKYAMNNQLAKGPVSESEALFATIPAESIPSAISMEKQEEFRQFDDKQNKLFAQVELAKPTIQSFRFAEPNPVIIEHGEQLLIVPNSRFARPQQQFTTGAALVDSRFN